MGNLQYHTEYFLHLFTAKLQYQLAAPISQVGQTNNTEYLLHPFTGNCSGNSLRQISQVGQTISAEYNTEYLLHPFTGNCSINSLRLSAKSVKPSAQNTIQNTSCSPLREIAVSIRCVRRLSPHTHSSDISANQSTSQAMNTEYNTQCTLSIPFLHISVSARSAGSQNNGTRKPSFVQQPT